MSDLPPLFRDQRKVDAEHLRLLAIFQFVFAGLAVAGIGFLCLHYALMSTVMNNPEMWKNQKGGPPPAEFFAMFKWFYLVFGVLLVLGGVANLLSGLFIRKRTNRMFSLVVAGINCIQFPFGTTLGVFTFIVLGRDSVREIYEAAGSPFTTRPPHAS
ncbi:MAG: hypothetical protein WC661_19610 [Opitutaceae bacterium]|jgi:phage shock protein PspC (stress-responsive transcriptional regulator)